MPIMFYLCPLTTFIRDRQWLKQLLPSAHRRFRQLIPMVVLLLSTKVFAENTVHSTMQDVRFVTEIMPPFQINEAERLTGFAVEIIEEIQLKANLVSKIEVLPWARAYQIAIEEPNVFIFTMVMTPERQAQFKWVEQYYVETDSFYALRSRTDINILSIEDAKRYVTCIPRNDVGEERLAQFGFDDGNLRRVSFQSQCLGMLYRGRVDLNLFNGHGIASLSRKFDVNPQQFRRVFVVSKAVMGLAANINTSDALVNKVRLVMQQILQTDNHQARLKKWFGDQTETLLEKRVRTVGKVK